MQKSSSRHWLILGLLCAAALVLPVAGRRAPAGIEAPTNKNVSAAAASGIAGCPSFPASNVWNTAVDQLPVDPHSEDYIQSIGPDIGLHPDFGSGTWQGQPIGIPYNLVTNAVPGVNVTFYYNDESDHVLYPIPPNPLIEGGSDRHLLIVERDHCFLYELFDAQFSNGQWSAGSGGEDSAPVRKRVSESRQVQAARHARRPWRTNGEYGW